MNSNFWQSSNYDAPNETSHQAGENISPFPSNLRNIELNYETPGMLGTETGGHNPLPSSSGLVSTISPPPSTTELHYRVISPTQPTNFHYPSNSTHTFNNHSSLPGFASTNTLPNVSTFPLLHDSTLFAPNNHFPYSLIPTTSSHQTYPATTHSFTSSSSLEHRNRPGLSSSIYPGMPPPSRSLVYPTSPTLVPMSVRHEYSPTSYHNRPLQSNANPLFQLSNSPSPPLSSVSRVTGSAAEHASPSGSSAYGYVPGSLHIDIPTNDKKDGPPFEETKRFHQLMDDTGRILTIDIQAKFDKGLDRADSDWFCYRRNYFAVLSSFDLGVQRDVDFLNVYITRGEQRELVHGFYMLITATVNGEDGRAIELVKHTAKRDKGPVIPPRRKAVRPNSSGNLCLFSGTSTLESPNSDPETPWKDLYKLSNLQNIPSVANFDRIQFKKATANNGKRRAAQQYFHIVIELHVKINRPNGSEEFIKVAHRVSDPMVVRGRSPGHYANDTKTSGHMGGGTGTGGGYGTASKDPTSSYGMNSDSTMSTGLYSIRSGGPSAYRSHSHMTTVPYTNMTPTYCQQPMEGILGPESSTQSHSSFDYQPKYSPDYCTQSRPYTDSGYMIKPPAMFDKLSTTGIQTSYDLSDSYTSTALHKDERFFKRRVKIEEKQTGVPLLQSSLLST